MTNLAECSQFGSERFSPVQNHATIYKRTRRRNLKKKKCDNILGQVVQFHQLNKDFPFECRSRNNIESRNAKWGVEGTPGAGWEMKISRTLEWLWQYRGSPPLVPKLHYFHITPHHPPPMWHCITFSPMWHCITFWHCTSSSSSHVTLQCIVSFWKNVTAALKLCKYLVDLPECKSLTIT